MLMLISVGCGIFSLGLLWNLAILATMCGLEAIDKGKR